LKENLAQYTKVQKDKIDEKQEIIEEINAGNKFIFVFDSLVIYMAPEQRENENAMCSCFQLIMTSVISL
jgi:hypothetical protein